MKRNTLARLAALVILVSGCGDDAVKPNANPKPNPDAGLTDTGSLDTGVPDAGPPAAPGALVRITAVSQVGVLLDDYPAASRDRIAAELIAKPPAWWIARAAWQLRLTSNRTVYRKYSFDEADQDTHDALPLPPEPLWNITLDAAATRTAVDGHDYVAVPFAFEGTLLTDFESPGISEPMLASVGGTWDENFVFPVDPTLLLQRTGYACMSEDEFPAESIDAEDAFRFYDDTCEVEVLGMQSCHLTEPLPTESCADAVTNRVGHVAATLHYERIEWDEAIADGVRHGLLTEGGPDLVVLTTGEGLNDNRVIYKYIPAGHCSVVERCVGGPGWRRLLVFDSHDHNIGDQPIHIGEVDYFVEGLGGELIDHNVYTLSECHEHYHFQYYGNFSFGSGETERINKNGFCLESTDRLSNNESTPLHPDYTCDFQGVQAGWGDLYGSSLVCNWVDVTDVDTTAGPVTDLLTFSSNPDGFICEGELETDAMGNQVWEATAFRTEAGAVVDRPACTELAGTEANDVGSVTTTLPQRGGFVTQPCGALREHDLGPLRNCGFSMQPVLPSCTAGSTVTLSCTGGDAARPQVLRVCETSRVLGSGVDCTFNDALANEVVLAAPGAVTFTCPGMRDAAEPGGQYAIYVAPVWEADGAVAITCATVP